MLGGRTAYSHAVGNGEQAAQTHFAPARYRRTQPHFARARAVVEAQNALTAEVLDQCDTRDQFKQLFTDLYK